MAKKRKKPVKRKSHHRRIGSTGRMDMMSLVETGVGLLIGSNLGTIMQRQLTSVNNKVVSALQLAGGFWLSRKPNMIVAGIGYGVASAGAIGLSHETGLIHGIEDTLSGIIGNTDGGYYGDHELSGMSNERTLSGMDNETVMSGLGNGRTLSGDMPMMATNDGAAYVPTMGW